MRLKRKHRIRVFLSGLVNSTNAQNLNCRALMKYLDPEKFEVRALAVYSGNLDLPDGTARRVGKSRLANAFYSTPKAFYPIRYPAKIWHAIQLVRGILWSDVAYLCKPEHWKLQMYLCKMFGKTAFKTMEGAIIGDNYERCLSYYGSREEVCLAHGFTTNTYSITHAMRSINERSIGLKTQEKVLYLGVDTELFRNIVCREQLTDVCLVGNSLRYKGLNDFFVLAERFPELTFHVIGSGFGTIDPAAEALQRGVKNVKSHGEMSHRQLAAFLQGVQLHVFPSRSEGFPKVTLETSAAGVPNVVYGDYGAAEWIQTGESGFVVNTVDEMTKVIKNLLQQPDVLQHVAAGARRMAKSFDWRIRIQDWEQVITALSTK